MQSVCFSFPHFNWLFCSSPLQSVRDQVAWGLAVRVFVDNAGTAENQNKTCGPWRRRMDGIQPRLISLSPCLPFAFSELRVPNPGPSAAHRQGSSVEERLGQNLGQKSCPAGDPLWGCSCVPQQLSTPFPVCKQRCNTHPMSVT